MGKKKKFCSVLIKLRNTILIFLSLFILSIFLILSVHYRKIVMNNAKNQIRQNDEILVQSIENSIQNTESYCNTIIIQLNESLKGKNEDGGYPRVDTETQKKIYQCMINTFTMFHDADQVMVVWNNGTSYYQNRSENYSMNTAEHELLKEMEDRKITRKGLWLPNINSDCKIRGTGQYFAKAYADIDSGTKKGYIIFKINDVFRILNAEESTRKFSLYDQTGQLILASVPVGESEEIDSERNGYKNQTELYNKWVLASATDLGNVSGELNWTIVVIMMISMLIMGVLFLILNYIVKRIVMPVRTLSDHMIAFKGELPTEITVPETNDEIGVLVSHFNVMANKNKELFDLVVEKSYQQKRLELALLQSQIKPHFLYNTLDTIYCLIEIGRTEVASTITKLLSEYYRDVLSRGMDWVLLDDEVDQVRKYLEIQSVRYRNVLSYSIDFSPKVEMIKIPKLTLQPLVENAIYHGIKSSNRKGNLCIRITQNSNVIEIRVIDDGVGFSREKFEEFLMKSDNSDTGFGLRNVMDRLRLYYGDRCVVRLEEMETGTSILIQIQTEPEEV